MGLAEGESRGAVALGGWQFRRDNPRAAGATAGACPGYQIDHRVPLSRGGADEPDNMQWLSVEQHRAKTGRERR